MTRSFVQRVYDESKTKTEFMRTLGYKTTSSYDRVLRRFGIEDTIFRDRTTPDSKSCPSKSRIEHQDMPKMPYVKGEITEYKVAIAFMERGIILSKPIIPSARYDYIADIDNGLYRVQVKTSHMVTPTSFAFSTSSTVKNTRKTTRVPYRKSEVDFFATVFDGQCYLIPWSDCGNNTRRLHLAEPKNRNRNIAMAQQYELDNVLKTLADGNGNDPSKGI